MPPPPVAEVTAEAAGASDDPLDQAGLWDAVAARLREGDVVIADQGTSFYGMGTHRMPHGVTFIGQPLWAAIGYTLPALLGAALADRSRRPIVLIGDGAAQLTIAELGTLIRDRVPAVVVVVNNLGYTSSGRSTGPPPHTTTSRRGTGPPSSRRSTRPGSRAPSRRAPPPT